MKRNKFSLRRRQVMAIGAGAAAVPGMAVAAHDTSAGIAVHNIVVSGRVLGAPNRRPLAGAQVEVWQANARGVRNESTRQVAMTDGDGRYFVTVAAANRLHYRVSHQDYVTQVTQLHSAGVQQHSVTLTRDEAGAIRAAFEVTLAPRSGLASARPDYVAL